MTRLTAEEIEKLLDQLIGFTEPVGDSAVDAVCRKNLLLLIDVTEHCLLRIAEASSWRNETWGSSAEVGQLAHAALQAFGRMIWEDTE